MAEFDMTNLPNNSNKAKRQQAMAGQPQEKHVRQVTKASTRKKNLAQRAAETFIEEDVASVKDYVIHDVAIPTIKELFADVFIGAIEMMFLGERRGRSRSHSKSSSSSSNEKRSYTAYYQSEKSSKKSEAVDARRSGRYSVKEIIVRDKDEAIEILEVLNECLDQYEQVTVADLYDCIGESSNFIDNNWGWTDLRGAGYKRIREGYLICLPKVESL